MKTELNEKISAVKEMQKCATELLNGVSQNIAENKLLSGEKVGEVTALLTTLVDMQDDITKDIKSYLGGDTGVEAEYKNLMEGNFANAFAKAEIDRFLTITSDDGEYKNAIVTLQEEIKSAVSSAKLGELFAVVTMINRAVASNEEFLKVKDELRAELRSKHNMVYTGLLDGGYRFGEKTEETQPEVVEAPAPAASPAEPEGGVEWVCLKPEYKTSKCVGGFIETKNGRKHPIAARKSRLVRLEQLYYFGCLTEATFARFTGEEEKDWLIRQGYISRCVLAESGYSVVTVSAKGRKLLSNPDIFTYIYNRAPQAGNELCGTIDEIRDEQEILKWLAVGEVAAASYDTIDSAYNVIDFTYTLIVYEIVHADVPFGISFCMKEDLTDACIDAIKEVSDGKWGNAFTLTCEREGSTVKVTRGDEILFTVKIGERNEGITEKLQELLDELFGFTPAKKPEQPVAEEPEEEIKAEEPQPEAAETTEEDADDGSARCLADKLIKSKQSPKSAAGEYIRLMDRLVCEDRAAVAVALSFSLRGDNKEYADYYECLKHACGYGLDPAGADLNDLPVSEYDPRRRLAVQACAYSRALIKADAADYTVLPGAKSLRDYDWENTAWKKAFVTVLETVDYNHGGFSRKILSQLTDNEQKDKLLAALKNEAKQLLDTSFWKPNDPSPIFPAAFRRAFGPNSDIYRLLTAVTENDKTAIEPAEEFLNEFYSNNGDFDDQKLQDFRNKIWKEQGGNERLTSKIGNNFDKKCSDRLKLLEKWVALSQSVENKKGVDELRRRKDELIRLFTAAAISDGTVEGALLAKTAEELAGYLSGKAESGGEFAEFLLSDRVAVDEDERKPVLDDFSEEVAGLRAYHRILEHIALAADEKQADELIKARNAGDNYGMAASVAAFYNIAAEMPSAKAQGLAKADFKAKYDGLKADLDMAYTRGLIDESFSSRRQKEAENIYQFGKNSENYGLCLNLFGRFPDAVKDFAATKKPELIKRFESLQRGKEEKDYPIFARIRNQIEVENYTVAEEYLTRAEGGEREVEDALTDEFDAHGDFISKYDALYEYCQRFDGKTLDRLVQSIDDKITEKNRAELCLPDNAENNDIKAGRNWLRVLPGEGWLNGAPQNKVQFLSLLNFNVTGQYKRIVGSQSDFVDEFTLTPTKQNLANYAHPVSRFGTCLKKLNLFYINGKKGESIGGLIQNRQGSFTSDAVIVYLDSAIRKETRRKIAKDIKTQKLPQTFLVIDRVLALYLAFTRQAGRFSTMLKCTLPYTDFNPYCPNGAGSVDSEMFMGRERERNEISNINSNTCLVCGGRQLGKTVLLKRVGETMHDPATKKFSVYTGTRGDGTATVLEKLVTELKDKCALLGEKEVIKSWDELRAKCVKLYRENKYQSLIAFIDEGDAFIDEQRRCDYKALETLNAIRAETKNAFKFVLAGLHNISRESHDKNGFLAQLGSPLVIKPFSMREAKQLVEVPLLYLGYKFVRPDRLLPLILSHTNYYPGLLHLFCSDLIKYLSDNFGKYFNEVDNPPYIVSEDHVKAVVTSTGFKDRVKGTFDMTLKVQSARYKKIALALAVLYLEEPSQPGYTADQIKNFADLAYEEDLAAYHNLLTEMCDLGMVVEIKTDDGVAPKYVFLRQAFFGYVCDIDTLGRKDKREQVDALLSELGKIGEEVKNG